jgi:gluconolactonase
MTIAAYLKLLPCAVLLSAICDMYGGDSVFASKPTLLLEKGAGEGPTWHPQLGLLTTDGKNINRFDPKGVASVFREDSGSGGMLWDRQGHLIICGYRSREMQRLSIDGALSILTTSYDGAKYNNPNDLTIDGKNRIYFSDPRYGDRSNMEMKDANGKLIEGVYRIDPDGKVTRIITHEVDRPNGLIVTADDKYLFVADNNNEPGGARKLWRFNLQEDGSVDFASQRMIHDWGTTRGPDGMKLDLEGRLYVAAGLNKPDLPSATADTPTAGIYVFSPTGELLEFVNIPRDETTNCAFGGEDGKTLFVTAGGTLWGIKTVVAGYLIK